MYYVNPNIDNLYRINGVRNVEGFLRMDMNENPGGLPKEFVENVLREITPEYLSTYPDKNKLLRLLSEHLKCNIDNLFVGNGSDEVIRLIFECFTYQGSNIVTSDPTFAMYDVYANMFGVNNKKIEYFPDFSLDVELFTSAIDDKTTLVFALNPNNPIGTVFTTEEMEEIICTAQKNKAIVVIDEAYYYFHKKTFLEYIYKYDNVIILRTFSKLMSLANCRLGVAISNKEITNVLGKSSCSYNVNGIAIKFAEHLLEQEQLIEELVCKHEKGKKYLEIELKEMGYEVRSFEGNFLFFKPNHSVEEVERKLYEKKILVKTYSKGFLKDYIRVSTGEEKYMKVFLEVLKCID